MRETGSCAHELSTRGEFGEAFRHKLDQPSTGLQRLPRGSLRETSVRQDTDLLCLMSDPPPIALRGGVLCRPRWHPSRADKTKMLSAERKCAGRTPAREMPGVRQAVATAAQEPPIVLPSRGDGEASGPIGHRLARAVRGHAELRGPHVILTAYIQQLSCLLDSSVKHIPPPWSNRHVPERS